MSTSKSTLKDQNWLLHTSIAIALWSSLASLGSRLSHLPPFLLIGWALMIGALPSIRDWRDWFIDKKVLAFGITGIFGYHFLLFMAFRMAPPVEANLINYLWPVLIVLFSPVILSGFALRAHHIVGGLISFFGAALVATGGKLQLNPTYVSGYACAFFAAVVWAAYSVIAKRIANVPTAAVGGFCLFSGILALILHSLIESPYSMTRTDWLLEAGLGIGPMGLAFYSWDKAMKGGDPRIVGGLSYSIPLFSSLLLVWINGEKMTPVLGLAILLIVGGATLGSKELFTR